MLESATQKVSRHNERKTILKYAGKRIIATKKWITRCDLTFHAMTDDLVIYVAASDDDHDNSDLLISHTGCHSSSRGREIFMEHDFGYTFDILKKGKKTLQVSQPSYGAHFDIKTFFLSLKFHF